MIQKIVAVFMLFVNSVLYPEIALSLKDAVTLGLAGNSDMKIAEITLDDQRLSAYTIWNTLLPSAAASASTTATTTHSPDVSESALLTAGLDLSLSLTPQDIVNVYDAIYQYRAGRVTRDLARRLLKRDITKLYYALIISREEIKIKEATLKNAEYEYTTAKKGYKSGELSEIDTLKKEYDYRVLSDELAKLKNVRESSLNEFKDLLGLKRDAPVTLTDMIPEISEDAAACIDGFDVNKNRSVVTLQVTRQQLEIDRSSAAAAFFPTLSMSFSLSSTFSGERYNNGLTNPDNFYWKHGLKFGLSLPIDTLFPFAGEQVAVIKNAHALQRNALALEQAQSKAVYALEDAQRELRQIVSSYNNGKLNADIARKTYQLTHSAYDEGAKNYTELTDAEADYDNSRLALLKTRYDFIAKIADLEYEFMADLSGDPKGAK